MLESEQLNDIYPRSRASTTSESQIVRSRTWSEDITKTWTIPITGLETMPERAQRYLLYFRMTKDQLECVHKKLVAEMTTGLEKHRADPKGGFWESSVCSLKMIDTYVTPTMIPKGTEKGSSLVVDVGASEAHLVRGVKVTLEGSHKISIAQNSVSLRDSNPVCPKGLLDRNATASQLFDQLSDVVCGFKEIQYATPQEGLLPIGFSFSFPVEQRGIRSASLVHWSKGFETGRQTNDRVEGMDVAALLDCAFWRKGLQARTEAVINDTTGVLLACVYEKEPTKPPCMVGFVLAGGVNGSYIQPDASIVHEYVGCIVNCELGSFAKSLPTNDVDLEVDFADETAPGFQLFEKMVATTYLGEICRRLVVKVWQSDAPQLAWVRYSMPWVACARVVEDLTDDLTITREILMGLWEWDANDHERRVVKELFEAVFERSASLAAVAVLALSSQTGRLQPAMGGLTCAIEGDLYSQFPSYRKNLSMALKTILNEDTAALIHLHEVVDGAAKGAAIVAKIARDTSSGGVGSAAP